MKWCFISDIKKKIIISAITGLLLSVMMVWGYYIENYQKLIFGGRSIVIQLLVWIACSVVVFVIFGFLDGISRTEKGKQENNHRKVFVVVWFVLLLFYGIWFLALYPGLFVFDSVGQYEMYIRGEVTEFHPVLHTMLLGFIVDGVRQITGAINHGVALFVLLQTFVSTLVFAYVITFVYRKTASKWIAVLVTLFFGVYTPIVLAVLSITKDSYFFIFLLLALTLTIEMLDDVESFSKDIFKQIVWVFSVVLTAIFRNNCIYAIPFLVVGVCLYVRKQRVLFLVLASLGLGIGYKFLFVPFVTVGGGSENEMFSIPAQQLMRVYSSEEALVNEEERFVIEELIDEVGRMYYHPKIADMAKWRFDVEKYKSNVSYYNEIYIDLCLKNPKLFLEAFLENTCGFWYPGTELTLYSNGDKGYWVVDCYEPAVMNSRIPILLEYFKEFETSDCVTKNPLTSWLFAPATFFYLFVVMFAYAIYVNQRQYIVIYSFIFVLWLTYLLGPVALVRYAIYLYALAPLYFVQVLNPRQLSK